MKFMRTLLLLIVFAALAGYVYIFEIEGGEQRQKEEQAAQKLFHFDAESVQVIEIRNYNNIQRFERDGDDWNITRPVQTGGDNAAINGLLSTLEGLKLSREFTVEPAKMRDYGLGFRPPQISVVVSNGESDSLKLGDNTPVGTNMFAAKNDSVIYMIPGNTRSSVIKKLFDWRDKRVAVINQSDVRGLSLKNKSGRFLLEKRGVDWYLTAPLETRAENGIVTAMLSKLQNGRAQAIVSESLDNPSVFGLDRPAVDVELAIGEAGTRKQIQFSPLENNKSNVKDDGRPQVFQVDSTFYRDFNKSLFELRYKKIAGFDTKSVDSLVIMQADTLMIFVQDSGGAWRTSGGLKLIEWRMNSFLTAVSGVKASRFINENSSSPRGYGLAKPLFKMEAYAEGKLLQELLIGGYGTEQYAAWSSQSRKIVGIDKTTFTGVTIDINQFLEKEKTAAAEGTMN